MTWHFFASLDSDPTFVVDAGSGKRRSKTLQRFVGRLVLDQEEAFTLLGWKQPKCTGTWDISIEDDGSYDPPPDLTIRVHRATP